MLLRLAKIHYLGHCKGWALLAFGLGSFLVPNGTRNARCHFRAQISLDFQGPNHTIALVMDIARLKIITSRDIKSTGTLIVILYGDINFVLYMVLLISKLLRNEVLHRWGCGGGG